MEAGLVETSGPAVRASDQDQRTLRGLVAWWPTSCGSARRALGARSRWSATCSATSYRSAAGLPERSSSRASLWGGGHLNPAVSVALTIIGRFKVADLPASIGAQVVGALLAALALKGVFPDADTLGNNSLADGVSVGSGLLAEVVMTAIFLFVIVSAPPIGA